MAKKKNHPKATAMERLLGEGFFETKEAALPYFLSGAVFCGTEKIRTGGQKVSLDVPMAVRGLTDRYVGKGGYKLEGAIADFAIAVQDRVCIDAGACTGGFTDCLVQHGAKWVYAVEAGFGQLAGSLQQNPRVVNLEKTNLGDEKLLSLVPLPTLGSVDLSYLSLVKAVPQFRRVMHGQGELLCLVKPLFETESAEARRTGDIAEEEYEPLLLRLAGELSAKEGTSVVGITHSRVTGNQGTREFFLHVKFGENVRQGNWKEEAERAVQNVLALPRYEK